ncbi:ABC transporter ATP-binding protein [Pseudothauera nasutitermitis]|uniref:ABC transporter ATP-binding protein n=1 Tax=Pseudothauera nasutitermitis TaxID=2565930 RepID=A0A4S4APA7_9RHOO|nr:ABC transporter ATP-binding protein [Pseudothauera nasutitermitis]THF61509.1 ABC transporter ATP-binding protein [Pseudothauera nasutitermitis]
MNVNVEADRPDARCLLFALTKGRRAMLAGALALTALAVLAELVPFVLLYRALERLIEAPQTLAAALPGWAAWLGGALLLKYLAYGLAYLLSHHAAYAIQAGTRRQLVSRLARAPLPWLHGQGSGALKQSVVQDVERLEAFLAHHTVEASAAVLAPLCAAALLFWVDARLALAVLAVGPLALLGALAFLPGSRRDHDLFNRATAALNNATVEFLRNMPVMKVFCPAGTGFPLLRGRLHDYYRLAGRITRRTVPGWALFTSLLGAHLLLVLPVGAWLHVRGEVGAAQVAFAVLLGAGVFRPLLKVSRFFMDVPEIFAGLRRMAPILAISPPPRLPAGRVAAPVEVRLAEVRFTYPSRPVLRGVSLCLPPGSFNVLLGPSGAGKSTVARLVAGVLVPQAGEVSLNGEPVAALDEGERAGLIALATQEVFLFSGSIRDNLCLARPDASAGALRRALRVAQAEALVEGLPRGWDTPVRELGTRLSGGERQRIAVARALLAGTPVLVLDEATAFADSLTQRAFFRALRAEYPERTVLAVAHRLHGLERADRIFVLEQGVVTASGDHARLMRESAYYRSMWRLEALNEQWALASGGEAAHG